MDEVTKQRNIHKATRLALKNGNVKIAKLLIPLCDITGLFWGKNYLLTVLKKNQIDIFLQLIKKMNEDELKRFCPPTMIIHAMYHNEPELVLKLEKICGHEISPTLPVSALTKYDAKIFLQLLEKMNKESVEKVWPLKSIIFEAIKYKQYEIALKLNQIYAYDIFADFTENEVEVLIQWLGKMNKTEVKKFCPPEMVIHAMKRKKLKIAAYLMKICDYEEFNLLKKAILGNKTQTALMLIGYGWKLNNGKQSALILAINKGNAEVGKKLINKKCYLNFIDSSGTCALVEALYYHNYTIFAALIENGCDINLVGRNGRNAFWWAMELHNQIYLGNKIAPLKLGYALYRAGCKLTFKPSSIRHGKRMMRAFKRSSEMRAQKVCEVLVSENPIYEDFPKELAPFLFREDTLKKLSCLKNSSVTKRKLKCGDQKSKKKRRKQV